ncbi:MAG TPA: S8 family peptidase [Candidatus Thermoplasmatota archaeon]|jgi:serine protease AprX|nr:S8 family peptidase [Candidatus Thermoplasmatota archaeon]
MRAGFWGLVVVLALLAPAATSMGMLALSKLPDIAAPTAPGEDLAFPIAPGPEVPGITSSRWGDVDRNRLFDTLDTQLLPGHEEDVHEVIVLMNLESVSDATVQQLKQDIGPFTVTSYKDNPWDAEGRPWTILPAFAATLTQKQILQLSARSDVQQVEPVIEVHALMGTAKDESGVDKAKTDFGVNGDRTGAVKTYTKDDIVICVIDTGIRKTHSDLNEGQVIAWKDYVNGQANAYDDNGHGSHVSGIAAGQGDYNTAYRGVAHGAALVGVKVLNSAGSGSSTNIVNGINWCKDNEATYGIEIETISIGGGTCTNGTDSMSNAVNNAVNAGLVVTIAAGNSGPGYCTVGDPGAAANAITVGAVSDPDNAACGGYKAKGWYLADFSSRGLTGDGRYKPEIAAPGVCITSVGTASDTSYATMSGTSMATPFIAGVAALMLDADPNETPGTIKSMLMSTSRDAGPNNQASEPQSYDWGAGVVDAHTAVETAGAFANQAPPANPTIYPRTEDLAGTGNYDRWAISGVTTARSISVTLIIPSASANKDFDVRLYDPNGNQVASSLGTTRQETLSYTPATSGTFKVRVESYTGSGSYWLDMSTNGTGVTLEVDQ